MILIQVFLVMALLLVAPTWAVAISESLFWIVLVVEAIALVPLTVHFWRSNDCTNNVLLKLLQSSGVAVFFLAIFNATLNMIVHMATDGT